MMIDSNILIFLTSNPLTCLLANANFISCSPLTGFDDLIVACNLLCGMDVEEQSYGPCSVSSLEAKD